MMQMQTVVWPRLRERLSRNPQLSVFRLWRLQVLSAHLHAEVWHQGIKAFRYTKFQLINTLVLFSVEEKQQDFQFAAEKRELGYLHLVLNAYLKHPWRITLKKSDMLNTNSQIADHRDASLWWCIIKVCVQWLSLFWAPDSHEGSPW